MRKRAIKTVIRCWRHEGPPQQWWGEHQHGLWSCVNTRGRHSFERTPPPGCLADGGWVEVDPDEWAEVLRKYVP